MKSLAAEGAAMRRLLGNRLVMALADNDGEGRDLWPHKDLRPGGVWKQQSNGVWWCLLPPSAEFKAQKARFRFNDPLFWPLTLENAFSAAIRREAAAAGAYAIGNQAQPDLLRDPGNAKRAVEALLALAPDDDAYPYLRAPTPETKEPFAVWITAPERRTPEIYASFRPIVEGVKRLVERHAAEAGPQARLL